MSSFTSYFFFFFPLFYTKMYMKTEKSSIVRNHIFLMAKKGYVVHAYFACCLLLQHHPFYAIFHAILASFPFSFLSCQLLFGIMAFENGSDGRVNGKGCCCIRKHQNSNNSNCSGGGFLSPFEVCIIKKLLGESVVLQRPEYIWL